MSLSSSDIISAINKDWALELRASLTEDELITAFAVHLDDMIVNDFSQLIAILYRIDVSEQKIRQSLKENPMAEGGKVIAHLIVERQKQKLKTRELFRPRAHDIDEEDKW